MAHPLVLGFLFLFSFCFFFLFFFSVFELLFLCAQNSAHMLRLPRMCPSNAARVFYECTKIKPEERPEALTLVEWLREE